MQNLGYMIAASVALPRMSMISSDAYRVSVKSH